MQQHQHYQLPNAGAIASMHIGELMQATSRMTDLLQEESALIDAMRVGDIVKLQDEKAQLAKLLETYQQRLATDPAFARGADDKTREELVFMTDDLAFLVQENFRKVAAAKAVNQRILQAIMDVLSEDHRPGTYGRDGQAMQMTDMALSMNLNQKA